MLSARQPHHHSIRIGLLFVFVYFVWRCCWKSNTSIIVPLPRWFHCCTVYARKRAKRMCCTAECSYHTSKLHVNCTEYTHTHSHTHQKNNNNDTIIINIIVVMYCHLAYALLMRKKKKMPAGACGFACVNNWKISNRWQWISEVELKLRPRKTVPIRFHPLPTCPWRCTKSYEINFMVEKNLLFCASNIKTH